jgi:TATA-box binding protein (TBP) (component of TFIID and TFIIIB)
MFGVATSERIVQEPRVNNIKIRLVVSPSSLPRLKRSIERLDKSSGATVGTNRKRLFKKHHNFIVFRNSYVFIIFFSNGTVNITGIKSFSCITHALQTFCSSFRVSRRQITDYIIDNVSANGDFGKQINLVNLKQDINKREKKENLIQSASFNTNYFPAAFCKTYKIGTILVFNSGKFNIVGAKCQRHVREIFLEMSALIERL